MRLETRIQEFFHNLVTEEATFPPSEFIKTGITEVISKQLEI